MGCDCSSFVQIGSLICRVIVFLPFPMWRPSAILNWNFVILNYPRSRLCCSVSTRYSPSQILRFYDCASLAEKCLTMPPFFEGWVGGLNPLKLWAAIKNPKRHILRGENASIHKRLKSVQDCELGASPRKTQV